MQDALKAFKIQIQLLMDKYPDISVLGSESSMLEKFQRMGEFTELEVQNIDQMISETLKKDSSLTLKTVKIAFNQATKKHFNLA